MKSSCSRSRLKVNTYLDREEGRKSEREKKKNPMTYVVTYWILWPIRFDKFAYYIFAEPDLKEKEKKT